MTSVAAVDRLEEVTDGQLTGMHCEKFRTLISNSWPILQTSVTFPAHASIGMYGIKLIFECHITEKAGSKGLQDSNDG